MIGIRIPRNAVYVFQITARVCHCEQPPAVFATGRNLKRIAAIADGYHAVYEGFFGDQMVWLDMVIVDVRDGRIVWRDGRLENGVSYGEEHEPQG